MLFEEAVAAYPGSRIAWMNLGFVRLLRSENALDSAIRCFAEVVGPKRAKEREDTPERRATLDRSRRHLILGDIAEHFVSFWDIRLDMKRRLVWIEGDFGITLPPEGRRYAPYDFRGKHRGPCDLPEFAGRGKWYRYKEPGVWPWLLTVDDPSDLGVSEAERVK